MKTLFFIAALAGAVYLIMQTPAGQSWLESEPALDIAKNTQQVLQQKIKKVEQVSTQVAQSFEENAFKENALKNKAFEDKMTEFAQQLNQKQQTQISQLESRIAELENELIMGRIAQKQTPQSITSGKVTLHPYQQAPENFVASSSYQSVDMAAQTPDTLVATSDKQLQRNRQAMLQDIAQKMEMSSLQALVN